MEDNNTLQQPQEEEKDVKPVKKVSSTTETQNLIDIANKTGNLYKSIAIVSKRSRQINSKVKDELISKLNEFASTTDNLEEVFENREQIEISRFYEKMPNPALLALNEFMEDNTYYRIREIETSEIDLDAVELPEEAEAVAEKPVPKAEAKDETKAEAPVETKVEAETATE